MNSRGQDAFCTGEVPSTMSTSILQPERSRPYPVILRSTRPSHGTEVYGHAIQQLGLPTPPEQILMRFDVLIKTATPQFEQYVVAKDATDIRQFLRLAAKVSGPSTSMSSYPPRAGTVPPVPSSAAATPISAANSSSTGVGTHHPPPTTPGGYPSYEASRFSCHIEDARCRTH